MRNRFLVVEDDEAQATLLVEVLKRHGYEAQAFSSGEETLDHLRGDSADILLLDMELGHGMDGLETFMRAKMMWPMQKGIMVSRYQGVGFPVIAKECGLDGFLGKPFTIKELMNIVESAIKS